MSLRCYSGFTVSGVLVISKLRRDTQTGRVHWKAGKQALKGWGRQCPALTGPTFLSLCDTQKAVRLWPGLLRWLSGAALM